MSHYRRTRRRRREDGRQTARERLDLSPAAWVLPLAAGVATAMSLAAIYTFLQGRDGSRQPRLERSLVDHERLRRAPVI